VAQRIEDIQAIPISAIRIGTRKRAIDDKSVREIAQSIERQGLLQPIGVKSCGPHPESEYVLQWDLVFGAHRLAAYGLLQWDMIDAHILPPDLSNEEYLLIELQENSARNDLTQAQRKAYAAEVGELLSTLREKSPCLTETQNWFVEFIQKANIPRPTFYSWWNAFCAETGHPITPRQALDRDCQAFFAWLQEQQVREEAEKARRQAEARDARRRQDFADALENLETLATDYGRVAVIAEVIDVFLAQHPEEGNA
jgi:ParB-like nuclease family protein